MDYRLHKRLFELTGLETDGDLYCFTCKDGVVDGAKINDNTTHFSTPIYTSDYLLEKLPNWTTLDKRGDKSTYKYLAKCDTLQSWTGREIEALSDTPLEALLKLGIALAEKGLL